VIVARSFHDRWLASQKNYVSAVYGPPRRARFFHNSQSIGSFREYQSLKYRHKHPMARGHNLRTFRISVVMPSCSKLPDLSMTSVHCSHLYSTILGTWYSHKGLPPFFHDAPIFLATLMPCGKLLPDISMVAARYFHGRCPIFPWSQNTARLYHNCSPAFPFIVPQFSTTKPELSIIMPDHSTIGT